MEKKDKIKVKVKIIELILLDISLLAIPFFLFFSPFFINVVRGSIGENVTITSGVDIGNSAPDIISIDIESGSITLTPNSTTLVNCSVVIRDYDGDVDIKNVSADFFHSSSFYGDSDDNNYHYTNNSCYIDTSYGDTYTALASCLFDVWYYANAGQWNCSVEVNDYPGYNEKDNNISQIQSLLAIGLPNVINYGTVNATYVSGENATNITNFGNVMINLSLSGYAVNEGDGLAMNCTLGSLKNISIMYEKYNLTEPNSGNMDLATFDSLYVNLTSTPTVRKFNLNYRQNDNYNEAVNASYWRIYVPIGVAGSCQGNIIFGATLASEV